MVDHREAEVLMTISFIQYPLMISPENVNLDKIKSENLHAFFISNAFFQLSLGVA